MATTNGSNSKASLAVILAGGARRPKRASSPTLSTAINTSHLAAPTPRGSKGGGGAGGGSNSAKPSPRSILDASSGMQGSSLSSSMLEGAASSSRNSDRQVDASFISRLHAHQDLQTIYTQAFSETGLPGRKVNICGMMHQNDDNHA